LGKLFPPPPRPIEAFRLLFFLPPPHPTPPHPTLTWKRETLKLGHLQLAAEEEETESFFLSMEKSNFPKVTDWILAINKK